MKATTSSILDHLKIALSGVFILGILFSIKLWLSERIYPLTPIFHFFAPFPYPLDEIILAIFFILLVWVMLSRKSFVIFLTVVLCSILFLQDQSRLYPSFYEYFILLSLLALYFKNPEEKNAERTLMLCQFTIAAVYVWSGISKLNPYFTTSVFPWLVDPLHLPLYPLMPHFFALAVAASEVIFGIFLLIPRFRKIALYDLLIMHGFLFFLIGPFRYNWNDAAWAWNLGSTIFLYILFSNAHNFSLKKLFQPFSKTAFALVLLIGILPALNLVNLWDSALSFNVYSGNTDEAIIRMNETAYSHINKEAKRVAYKDDKNNYDIQLDEWNNLEFHAGTYPQLRIFKNAFKTLCMETGQDPSLVLTDIEKAPIFRWNQAIKTLSCDSNRY